MKIAICDSYYPQFLATQPLQGGTYQQELDRILGRYFGTFDAYSRNLRMLNHECIDIIANHWGLQELWCEEDKSEAGNHVSQTGTALDQIDAFRPDVIFLQDLSVFSAFTLRKLSQRYILAGQLSCRFDDDEKLKCMDVIFSSFPFYVERFEKLGVRGVFLPLAFDPIVLERAQVATARTHVSFVGGYGQHWETDELFTVLAQRTPIQFWGYGFEKAPKVIRDRWMGECWGLQQYEVYLRSHICLNRHGAISRGLTNNLRNFEVTGCGAVLFTEESDNLHEFFDDGECARYTTPEGCAKKINDYLEDPQKMLKVAAAGQAKTLAKHTYSQRMPIVAKVLQECLERKQVSA